MPPKGTAAKPQFITESGVILELRPIPPLVLQRWEWEYSKTHPAPMPPLKILANGEEWYDREDATFKEQRALWNNAYREAQLDFVWGRGVVTDPPKNWTSVFGLNGSMPKLNWMAEFLSDDEIESLTEAITSINLPTEKAVEEAEKNSTSG